jgi:hypothetical protein
MDTERDDLEDILNAEQPTAVAPAPEPASSQEPEPQTGVEEHDAAPPAAVDDDRQDDTPTVPRRALEDERRKRQELERRFDEMTNWLQSQQAPQVEQPELPDPVLDPEGFNQHVENIVQSRVGSVERRLQEMALQQKIAMSETAAKSRHQDYDDVVAVFTEAAKQHPQLAVEMIQQPDPASFAYQVGSRLRAMSEPQPSQDDLRAQIRAELMAEMGMAPAQGEKPQIPRSLAGATSAQPRNGRGQFAGHEPPSLDEILG